MFPEVPTIRHVRCVHALRKDCSMRSAFFLFVLAGPARPGAGAGGGERADLARFALPAAVGNLADHQLVSRSRLAGLT